MVGLPGCVGVEDVTVPAEHRLGLGGFSALGYFRSSVKIGGGLFTVNEWDNYCNIKLRLFMQRF